MVDCSNCVVFHLFCFCSDMLALIQLFQHALWNWSFSYPLSSLALPKAIRSHRYCWCVHAIFDFSSRYMCCINWSNDMDWLQHDLFFLCFFFPFAAATMPAPCSRVHLIRVCMYALYTNTGQICLYLCMYMSKPLGNVTRRMTDTTKKSIFLARVVAVWYLSRTTLAPLWWSA